jgi:hypothetical protein
MIVTHDALRPGPLKSNQFWFKAILVAMNLAPGRLGGSRSSVVPRLTAV